MARRAKPKPPTGSPKPPKAGLEVFPHQLRAGDRFTDEQGVECELVSQPTKSVGTQDFVATVRPVDRPAETREARWRAHERVRVRQG